MNPADTTRQTVEAHMSLLGWIPYAMFNKLGYWGVWNPSLSKAWIENTRAGTVPIRLATLIELDAMPEWDRPVEIPWKEMPDLSFRRFANLIILGAT